MGRLQWVVNYTFLRKCYPSPSKSSLYIKSYVSNMILKLVYLKSMSNNKTSKKSLEKVLVSKLAELNKCEKSSDIFFVLICMFHISNNS